MLLAAGVQAVPELAADRVFQNPLRYQQTFRLSVSVSN